MSKKYMRIYCNGEKIRSTGSSIEDIHRVLNEFGCYNFNQILNTFQNANGFATMNIKQGWSYVGKMLVPSDIELDVELRRKINNLVLYLDNQRSPHKICIHDMEHYFSFSVEIVKQHGKMKDVIDRFNLPIGLKIYFVDNIEYFEFVFNVNALALSRRPWNHLYHNTRRNIKIAKEKN